MQLGARKCSHMLLSLLFVAYSKTRNARNRTGNTHTHIAALLGQRLQTTKLSRAAIVTLKSHSLVITSNIERDWPIRDQMNDSIIAVPKMAMARFRRSEPTVRKKLATGVFR